MFLIYILGRVKQIFIGWFKAHLNRGVSRYKFYSFKVERVEPIPELYISEYGGSGSIFLIKNDASALEVVSKL
jgi:hypothetical protein